MSYQYRILHNYELDAVIPLVYALNEEKISKTLLVSRFNEMKLQNYECAGVYNRIMVLYKTLCR